VAPAGLDVLETNVNYLQGQGINTFTMAALKDIVSIHATGRMRRTHVINRPTVATLTQIVSDYGRILNDARISSFLAQYPQVMDAAGTVQKNVLAGLMGLSTTPRGIETARARDSFVTALIPALEALQENGIVLEAIPAVRQTPLVRVADKAGYVNTRFEFTPLAWDEILQANTRQINIASQTASSISSPASLSRRGFLKLLA
jgi:hypothetical protein